MACKCDSRKAWRVATYHGNRSAFNGYHFTPSDYSEVVCDPEHGGCGRRWRTKAAYVEELPRGGSPYQRAL
jgi:hypothetical protein